MVHDGNMLDKTVNESINIVLMQDKASSSHKSLLTLPTSHTNMC